MILKTAYTKRYLNLSTGPKGNKISFEKDIFYFILKWDYLRYCCVVIPYALSNDIFDTYIIILFVFF